MRHERVQTVGGRATRLLTAAFLVVTVSSVGVEPSWAAPKPPLSVSVAPSSVAVVSSSTFTFTFTASESGSGAASVLVPASPSGSPWSGPQVSDDSLAGFVSVSKGSCNSAGPAHVSGSGPWTITVDYKCAKKKSFSIVYGAGAAQATSPSLAGAYTFTTQVGTGRNFLPVGLQPVVAVTPGPAAGLELTGLADASAGAVQAATVTARDAYGNVASGYRGTVAFSSTDAQASLPSDATFTAADAGSRTVDVTLVTAGLQSVTATDTANAALTDTGTATIAPGPITQIDVDVTGAASYRAFSGREGGPGSPCGAATKDAYGNLVTANVTWTSTDPHASLPGNGTPVPSNLVYFACNFGTAGEQTVTVELADDPEITDSLLVNVVGPIAYADDITVDDPTHNFGKTRYPLSLTDNDAQTSGLTGNTFFGRFTNTIESVTQPSYEEDGITYQVGVLGVSGDGYFVIWDLDPPAETEATIDGATLVRCPGDADPEDACRIDADITAEYTIFDGVNVSEPADLTLHLDTPDEPPLPVPIDPILINGNDTSVTATIPSVPFPIPLIAGVTVGALTPTSTPNLYTGTITGAVPNSCAEGCMTYTANVSIGSSTALNGLPPSMPATLSPNVLLDTPLDDVWVWGAGAGWDNHETTSLNMQMFSASTIGSPSFAIYVTAFEIMGATCKELGTGFTVPCPGGTIP